MTSESYWAIAGLLLIIADVIFGTFFMLFVGIGAIFTAGLMWSGLVQNYPAMQWIVFAATSAAGVLLFRNKLVNSFGGGSVSRYNEHKGQPVLVTETIPNNGMGRVKYKGAEWPARTANGEALHEGNKAEILKTDGIILEVIAV